MLPAPDAHAMTGSPTTTTTTRRQLRRTSLTIVSAILSLHRHPILSRAPSLLLPLFSSSSSRADRARAAAPAGRMRLPPATILKSPPLAPSSPLQLHHPLSLSNPMAPRAVELSFPVRRAHQNSHCRRPLPFNPLRPWHHHLPGLPFGSSAGHRPPMQPGFDISRPLGTSWQLPVTLPMNSIFPTTMGTATSTCVSGTPVAAAPDVGGYSLCWCSSPALQSIRSQQQQIYSIPLSLFLRLVEGEEQYKLAN